MRRATLTLSLISLSLLLVACAQTTTRVQDTWSAPGFQPPPKFAKVFTLLVSQNRALREQVEGAVAVQMPGVTGVPAFIAVPDSDLRDPQRTRQQLLEIGADGAIVMRPLGGSRHTDWIPDDYPDFWGYYGWVWPTVCDQVYWDWPVFGEPGYTVTQTDYQVEIRVYDLKTGRQIWSSLTYAATWRDDPDAAQDLIAAVETSLRRIGMVP